MDADVFAFSEYVPSTRCTLLSRSFANAAVVKVRLVGGPILIALQYDASNEGLYIAAIILLNVGAIPLIATNLGFARAM